MQVVRTELPPLKYLDGYIKLPTAKGAVFAELLPAVAVRRVAGNSTLYSVVYRRRKKKEAKKAKKPDVSSPLIVTIYQSDLRAKKFNVLLKMKVDVRLTTDEKSHRFGVAVAVDEVVECVYAVYSRDELPVGRRQTPGTRLLLRRVKLTLAAADARGVRRLQRPGVTRRPPLKSISKIFEARTYFGFGPLKLMANQLKAEEGVVVQQLVIDKGSLLLFSKSFGSLAAKDDWPVVLLELNEKRASMNVRSLPPVGEHSVYGHSRRKYTRGIRIGSPHEERVDEIELKKPYLMAPSLRKLGTVADAACRRLNDALQVNSVAHRQIVGSAVDNIWCQVSACRCHQLFFSISRQVNKCLGLEVVAVRGMATIAPQLQIVSARLAPLSEWPSRYSLLVREVRTPFCNVSGSWLLLIVALQSARRLSATKLVILRASLRSLLPPKAVCSNCNVDLRPSPPDKNKVCKVCRIRSFTAYSWVFGCHFCSAACLRDAWPQHSHLHRTPPLRKWTDANWKQWRRDNFKQ